MSEQYLSFNVDGQTYGIQISAIREINRISEITKVPDAPLHIIGVMNLRGKVIPVVSLRLRMNLTETQVTRETCTVVVETANGQVGVVVDSVRSVLSLEKEQIDPTPLKQGSKNYVIGIGKIDSEMIMLIDIERCLGDESFHPEAEELNEAA